MRFQRLPGFRDFYPEAMRVRRHVEGAWHKAARAAGFEEVDGPPLESLDLFKAKSGDAIAGELYAFRDKGDREVALRAELTPTVARMIAEKANALRKPVKWYAVPQLFRYERQQRGRLREHIQWNVDVFGAAEPAADAELVAVAVDGLRRLGLTEAHVEVRVSHRGTMAERVRRRFGDAAVEETLAKIDKGQLPAELSAELLRDLDASEAPELAEFRAACDDLGLAGFVRLDPTVVRGLAYYTGTVFEIWDRKRELRAVAGGGRYDKLIETLGGPPMPALGFGMGDVVLTELLEERGLLPPPPPRLDDLVVPIGDEMLGPARRVARLLRDAGRNAEAPYAATKLNKAMQAASQAGAARVILVGPEEWAQKCVVVKEREAQRTVPLEKLA